MTHVQHNYTLYTNFLREFLNSTRKHRSVGLQDCLSKQRMAEGRRLTDVNDDDLYSDFNVVEHELNEDLASTPGLAEAVQTSQLARRVPSTSTSSRPSASIRRSTDVASGSRPPGIFDEGHSGPPPLTAIHRAGYSSVRGNVSRVVSSEIPGGEFPKIYSNLSGNFRKLYPCESAISKSSIAE